MRTLLTIRRKYHEPSFWEVMDSLVLRAYRSLTASTITSLSELYFRLRRVILSVQTKKWTVASINYCSSKSSWKSWRWVSLCLTFMMRLIHIDSNLNPLTKCTSSSRSTEFKNTLPQNISQIIRKTVPISTRIVKRYVMKWASHVEIDRKSMKTQSTTWSGFPNGGKASIEQILVSEERNKSKRQGLWKTQSGIWERKLTIWLRSFEMEKIITEFTSSTSFTRTS